MTNIRLRIVPMTWKEAGEFVDRFHRHHRAPRGCKFAIGAVDQEGTLRGVALCGRPVSRVMDDGTTIEVSRTATDGCRNANSFLYGACWRIASAMGYARIITYNQKDETGASLRAANFELVRNLPARSGWAESSKKYAHLRDPVGSGGVERNLWQKTL